METQLNNLFKVKNINNTAQSTCKCGSWIDHWRRFSKQQLPPYCPEIKCTERPELGAHVQLAEPGDENWYLVPLCRTHNAKRGETLEISNYINLVPANVGETCG